MRWLSLALLFAAAPAFAQPVAPDAPCSYAECAIRIEPGFLGTDIVRGPVGAETVLGGVGLFLSDLSEIVADVPEAQAFADQQQRLRGGSLLLIVGGALLTSAAFSISTEMGEEAGLGASLAGFGLILYGSSLAVSAQRAQARAVWEYNRSLAEE